MPDRTRVISLMPLQQVLGHLAQCSLLSLVVAPDRTLLATCRWVTLALLRKVKHLLLAEWTMLTLVTLVPIPAAVTMLPSAPLWTLLCGALWRVVTMNGDRLYVWPRLTPTLVHCLWLNCGVAAPASTLVFPPSLGGGTEPGLLCFGTDNWGGMVKGIAHWCGTIRLWFRRRR